MLAIVIPYYKLTYFEETIRSLANQTNKNFKVYIGNDASPESPDKLIEKYKSKLDFKYKKFETNLGSVSLVKQWKRCIDLIGDEKWILILGDDDVLSTTVVEKWHENYECFEGKSNVVRFSTKTIYETTSKESVVSMQPKWERAVDAYFRGMTGLTGSTLSEYIFTKEAYDKIGFVDYPLAWHSDNQAWLDFSQEKPIFTINEAIVYIRISHLNITGRNDNLELKNKASLMFQKAFIADYLYQLPKRKRLYFLLAHESRLKANKEMKAFDWLFFFKIYLKNFELISFLKFIRRFLIYIFLKDRKKNI